MRDFTAAPCLFVAARKGRACRDRNRNARALPRARLAFLNTGGLAKEGTLITPNTFDYTRGEHTKVTEVSELKADLPEIGAQYYKVVVSDTETVE